MIINDTYNHKHINRQIIESVGLPFSFLQRIKMNGNGSPRLLILESSASIQKLLDLDSNATWCYIEIRPKGIILRFRSLLETFAFVIPWWKLVVFKCDAKIYSLHCDDNFVKLRIMTAVELKFMRRLMDLKLEETATPI